MNWPPLIAGVVSAVGLIASLISGWVALALRAESADLRTELERMRTEFANQRVSYAERRADEFQKLRSDINGSYMRANEVRAIVEGIQVEIGAIAARITLMEKR
jgi:hypothetical protein